MLLFISSLFAGIVVIREKQMRIRALRELCCALELMQDELSMQRSSIPELCKLLGNRVSGMGAKLFTLLDAMIPYLKEEDFASIWKRAVMNCCGVLKEAEREELAQLGSYLGRYEIEDQVQAIRYCCAALQRSREEALQAFPAERKLCLGLSMSAGVLAAVLLL